MSSLQCGKLAENRHVMNYAFLKDIIGSPWQIDVQTLNGLLPILRGMVNGLNVEKGTEPSNHLPYALSASSREVVSMSQLETLTTEDGSDPSPKFIHVLPIRSVLTKHDQDCGPVGTRTLASRLSLADSNDNIIGHILVVESGGGQAIAVAELTEAMQRCTKPMVVWIDGVAASAAYYISSYAREIIASRDMDLVGCIGTMLVWEGRKSISEENKDGEIQVTIYADGSEQKNAEYDAAINEFNFLPAKERMLNPLNAKFQSDVLYNRQSATEEQLMGRTFFASEVVGTLIDSIGNFDSAVERILALASFKTDTPKENNQTIINTTTMVKQFLHLNQVLNVPSLEGSEEGVFLNQEQLESINQGLEANQQLASERHSAFQERDTANTALATLQQQVTDAQATAGAAYEHFNAIDPSVATAQTPEAKAQAIRTLLAAKPAAPPVQSIGKVEEILADDADWDTINSLAHNKQVDSNS